MNFNKPKMHTIILIPLLVMLTLTLLVGGTAYQLTHTWEEAVAKETRNLTQALILNNIRWGLRQAQQSLESDPEEALRQWNLAKRQMDLVTRNDETPTSLMGVKQFLEHDENITRIETLLKQDFSTINLAQSHQALLSLQDYSRNVTLITTLSMLGLGLVLMLITARDLGKLFNQLVQSRDLGVSLQEEERRRIAQELHDGVIQELIALKRNYSPQQVDHLVHTIRRICHNLKPQILEDLGLPPALELLADDLREDGKRSVQLSMDEEALGELPKDYELPIFRVVQELFNNVKKHSEATRISLTLVYDRRESPLLRLYLNDNGKGFNPREKSPGMGIRGVFDRIHRLEGRLEIDSRPGQGASFQMVIPVEAKRNGRKGRVHG